MKQLFNSLLSLLFLGLFLFGCSDSQPLEPTSDAQSLLKGVPANGNGNKVVTEFDDTWVTACGLNVHMTGWSQFKVFGPEKNRNISIEVFHLVLTYTNAEGEKFVWHDVGPDHWYWVGEDLYVSLTGRSTGSGVIGHVVFNVSQGEFVQISGKEFGDIDELACSVLGSP